MIRSRIAGYSLPSLIWLALSLSGASLATACPFCGAVSQTLRQEMQQTDVVAFAKVVPGTETESDAEFEILTLLGENNDSEKDLVRVGQKFRINFFGKAKPDQRFMIMGVDPPNLLWSTPLPISQKTADYITAITRLPAKESLPRLRFYLQHLEHPEPIIARDAYDEFASAPYSEIIALKEDLDREQLLKWIQATDLPADRKRLYLVMLGVCGKPEDAELLAELMRSDDPNRRAGLDAMIACYVTLKGADGLELIDELFLANTQSQYADTYAAIMALRFHGTEGGVIAKERVLESMRLILDRPELADLVISDLARWEDWSQIQKLVGLFKNADEKTSWVRVPVINYLRVCPLPEAERQLEVLKEIDPAAFKRATSFFPVPKTPSSSGTDTSSISTPRSLQSAPPASPVLDDPILDGPILDGPILDEIALGRPVRQLVARDILESPRHGESWAAGGIDFRLPTAAQSLAATQPNRTFAMSVMGMVSVTLWLTMWLAISGAGKHGLMAQLLCRLDGTKQS